jgi:mannitol/fructose-specific phosphotransferase system IIA component (Ntr-type)
MRATRHLEVGVLLADIFALEAAVPRLSGRDRPAVVRELVGRLAELGRIPRVAEASVVEGILAQESLGPTAFSGGLAAPNCRTSATEEFVGAVGLAPEGIPSDALGGEPVYGVFVVLAPLDRREQHYELLGRIAALGADKTWRLKLRACRTSAEVHDLLKDYDRG